MSARRDDRPDGAKSAADSHPAPDDDRKQAKPTPQEQAQPVRHEQGTTDPDALADGWEPV